MTKRTIGQIADALFDAREEKRELEEQVKIVQERIDKIEQEAFELADSQQTTVGKGKRGAFSITELVVPQVKDWPAFYKFVKKNDFFHLLERRPSVTGCRELFETKGAIPGVERFTKRKINLRGVE
jgi:hypothetical protein